MTSQVPKLLERLRGGDQTVLNQLVAALYDELRRIAARHFRGERQDHTLQTTALVHEAYMKLCDASEVQFADRVHFLAVASRVMREILVDYARARSTKKRGGEGQGGFTTSVIVGDAPGGQQLELLDLDRALEALAAQDESLASVVEKRYFGGMTAEEIAEASSKSVHVVRHDLRFAQAWLRRKLAAG